MRVLRSSLYVDPASSPITTVMRESDLKDTIESVCASSNSAQPEALILHEIFTMPDDVPIQEASAEALRRHAGRKQKELNQAVLYYWTIMQWRIVKPGGTLMMDKPAPLDYTEISAVLEQLAEHPGYEDFRIVSHTEGGEPITLLHGRIEGNPFNTIPDGGNRA